MIFVNSSPKNALKIFQPFLPIFVPVGVGSLLAVLHDNGIEAKFVDEQVDDKPLERIQEYLIGVQKPYIFGFSVLTAAYKSAIELSLTLKKLYPDSIIVFGGLHPTAVPDEVLKYKHIDYVFRGESEMPFLEFYKNIQAHKDVSHTPNLSHREHGKVVHNPLNTKPVDPPVFPYHLFDPKKYDLGFILSSRGCPYNCIFCSNRISTGKKYRYKDTEAILAKLEKLYSKYGRKYVLFLDDNFLVDRKRVYELIDGIKQRGLHRKMTFNFQARGDNVDYPLLKDLYEAGFRSIFFGLETASEKLMKLIQKGETVEQCKRAVRMAKHIGFHVSATFIYGLPGETFKDRMRSVALSHELDLDMVRFNNATPYPGTELFQMAKQENRLHIQGLYENFNSVSTFIENPFNPIPMSYVPKGSTEAQIRRDILYSYFSFYLNLGRLKKIFFSPDKGVGWFNAGESLRAFLRKVPALASLSFMMLVKFGQLFVYVVLKPETRISLNHFLGISKYFLYKPEPYTPGADETAPAA